MPIGSHDTIQLLHNRSDDVTTMA